MGLKEGWSPAQRLSRKGLVKCLGKDAGPSRGVAGFETVTEDGDSVPLGVNTVTVGVGIVGTPAFPSDDEAALSIGTHVGIDLVVRGVGIHLELIA